MGAKQCVEDSENLVCRRFCTCGVFCPPFASPPPKTSPHLPKVGSSAAASGDCRQRGLQMAINCLWKVVTVVMVVMVVLLFLRRQPDNEAW